MWSPLSMRHPLYSNGIHLERQEDVMMWLTTLFARSVGLTAVVAPDVMTMWSLCRGSWASLKPGSLSATYGPTHHILLRSKLSMEFPTKALFHHSTSQWTSPPTKLVSSATPIQGPSAICFITWKRERLFAWRHHICLCDVNIMLTYQELQRICNWNCSNWSYWNLLPVFFHLLSL